MMKKGAILLSNTSILNITDRIDIIITKFSILLQAMIKGIKAWNTIKDRIML